MQRPPRTHGPTQRRNGVTLIEALVVLFILGLLMAIVLPAIQSAREASRRMSCGNHLKQLGLATLHYETTHGTMPPLELGGFSPQTRILPFLEQTNFANAFNFQLPAHSGWNRSVGESGLSILRCPSDPTRRGGDWTNYPVNYGRGFRFGADGPFGHRVGLRDVTDGTTQTAAIAEWALPPRLPGRSPRGTAWALKPAIATPARFEEFADRCDSIDPKTATPEDAKGHWWYEGLLSQSGYNHTLPINHNSCSNDGTATAGAWTASSHHPGGANVLFLDGHVRFVVESISRETWRSHGSRQGGELVSSGY